MEYCNFIPVLTFEEANLLFPIVFREGTSYYKDTIAAYGSNDDPDACDTVYFAYQDLQSLHRTAESSGYPGLAVENFSEDIEAARIKAGDARFAYAEKLEAEGNLSSIRDAVQHYEIAKSRNPEIPGIDERIAKAIEKGTLTLMVCGYSEDTDGFNGLLTDYIETSFADNRFLKVLEIPASDYADIMESKKPEKIAIMYAKASGVDYLLSASETKGFKKIYDEMQTRLPSEMPIFNGKKISIGYTTWQTLDYTLVDIRSSNAVIADDTIEIAYTSPLYEISFAKSEGIEKFPGENGTTNYRYIEADPSASNEQIATAYSGMMRDLSRMTIPTTVYDPTSLTQWTEYYRSRYLLLENMIEDNGGQQLFYDPEVIFTSGKTQFYTIGNDLVDARNKEEVRSAILNARLKRARELVEEVGENLSDTFYKSAPRQLCQVLAKFL
jgi:hypothetical protein